MLTLLVENFAVRLISDDGQDTTTSGGFGMLSVMRFKDHEKKSY